ncbi:MAG: LLM class flavin-dependent oxidoreductase [Thaumarchaeota archaeon]|nr:LLM class flavin-dependent oxidoreductase [Nitrososphaerota archaeon]
MATPNPALKIGINLSSFSPRDIVDLGILADELGFYSVWIPDHLADLPPAGDRVDPWVLLGAIGYRTTKVKLLTGVTDPVRIHPAKIANIVATLDELTGGRADLAIGAGEGMNLNRYGLPWNENPSERRSRLKEAVLVIRGLLRSSISQPFSYHGKFHNLDQARIDQKPVHDVKMILGAMGGKKTLQLVGEIADGWFPAINSIDSFERGCSIIDESAKANDRDPRQIERIHDAFIVMTNGDQEKERKSIDAFRYLLFTIMSKPIMNEMSEKGLISPAEKERYSELSYQYMDPTDEGVKRAFSIAKKIPSDTLSKYLIIGRNPAEIMEKLEPFAKAGARQIVLNDVYSLIVSASSQDCKKFMGEMSHELQS